MNVYTIECLIAFADKMHICKSKQQNNFIYTYTHLKTGNICTAVHHFDL